MKKKIVILGSTGSIGKTLLKIISEDKKNNFYIDLLSANKNYKLLLEQAKKFNVRNLILTDLSAYNKAKSINKNHNLKIYNNFDNFNLLLKNKIDYTINSIVGIDGLLPTIKIIKFTKCIAIANKESIICGWNLIKKELDKHKCIFVPVDSEHFSIWFSLNFNLSKVHELYLTASGGPFYKKKFTNLDNVNVEDALKHPTWKMGKKISIDSATLINKVFEIIEAKKIFNLKYQNLKIIIHPDSYVHSILKFRNGIIKLVAHDTTMEIPLLNSLNINSNKFLKNKIDISKLNNLNFDYVSSNNFPLVELLNALPNNDSLFETVIVTINDYLVELFLNNKIKFTDISKIMFKMIKIKFFKKYKLIYPSSVKMILNTKTSTESYLNKFFNFKNV
jgi:1-deoxy-D-xylulose-5-phosphate reductoisomerase